jgi:N-acetylmuramoyl-L-alanine amidase
MTLRMAAVLAALLLGQVLLHSSEGRGARKAQLPRIKLYGREFVDLEAWARTKRLEFHWDKDAGELRLTNRWTDLGFAINSCRTEINGVMVWLALPITPRNEDVYVSSLDAQTVLNPLLNPVKNKPKQRIRVVALDAGHGGKDPGNNLAEDREKTHNLLLAQEVKRLLEAAGLKVVMTRTADKFVELAARPAFAKRKGANLFVSLHYNAAGRKGVKGVEVYCLKPAGAPAANEDASNGPAASAPGNPWNSHNILLAYQIQKALLRNLEVEDRGVRHARFAVLRLAEMPAVLVEGGFMTDREEAERIRDASYREELARAIVDGLLDYKRLVER